jgi:uncharacterized membrane protein
MRKSEWFLIIMAVVFFATGAWFYPQLPAQVASHWNAAGQVNGSMSRALGAFLVPIIFTIIAAVFLAIPHIDPRRANIARFRTYFDWLVVAIALVLYYVYLLTLWWNINSAGFGGGAAGGGFFNLTAAIIPPFAALIYIGGMILPHTEPNWFIGVRTPWTISSDAVWHKTNQAGGWTFRASGIIALIGIFFPPAVAIWFLAVPVLASTVGLVIYSYVLYERTRK